MLYLNTLHATDSVGVKVCVWGIEVFKDSVSVGVKV
jgi:hypothetical protein